MPPALIGLIIAAILAATMSTHSGAINSLAAATTHDIYLPLTKRRADDPSTLRDGQAVHARVGRGAHPGARCSIAQQGTPVVVVALSIASFTYGGLLGGFFLGMLWPRAIQRDAIIGMSVGIAAMAFVVFAKPLSAAVPCARATARAVGADRLAVVRVDRHGAHHGRRHPLFAHCTPPRHRWRGRRLHDGNRGRHRWWRDAHDAPGWPTNRGRSWAAPRAPDRRSAPVRREHSADVIAGVVRDALASCGMTHVTPEGALRRRRRRGARAGAPGALAGARRRATWPRMWSCTPTQRWRSTMRSAMAPAFC